MEQTKDEVFKDGFETGYKFMWLRIKEMELEKEMAKIRKEKEKILDRVNKAGFDKE